MEKFFSLVGVGVLALGLVIVMSLIPAWLVLVLWNWLMPAIFGLPTIAFWQAFGITILFGILFRSTGITRSNRKE